MSAKADKLSVLTASHADGRLVRRGVPARVPVVAGVLVALTSAAQAQVVTDTNRAPTLTNERYGEDWSYLADPVAGTGRWTEPFKYIPLNADGSLYLSTGVEIRSRYEGYSNVGWGADGEDSYFWHRIMPYADLHAGKVRVFAQPIFSEIVGTDRLEQPVDTTGTDMLQAFIEAETEISENISLRMSAGRKLVSLGGGRFIDTRYGPNVPRAFDGVDATLTDQDRQVTTFYYRPVDATVGDFDDRASREKEVWGIYATQWLTDDRKFGTDLYYLGLQDHDAVYDQGVGDEVVHMFGSRIFGDTGTWYWNLEGAIQRGTFGDHTMAAWGLGGEFGHRFFQMPLQPQIALTADIISGDDDPDDSRLGTFNPLFPKGKYFGELSPLGPRNLIRIQPSVTIHPRDDVAVSLTGTAYWRESTADGVYGLAGNLVRSGRDSDARFVGNHLEFAVSWQATTELSLSVSASLFEAGQFIEDTGPSETITMVGIQTTFRF